MTLRYAWRSLAKSPGFVAIAVVALGMGLGLSTTMFAVMDAVLHPYVAYRDPETLFRIQWWLGRRNPMGGAELYRYIRDNTRSFAGVVPFTYARLPLRTPDGEDDVFVTQVSPRFLALTGMRVARGRPFTAGDGGEVAIVSHDVWRRLFPGRRTLSGATISLGERTYAVVGVLPLGSQRDVLTPIDSAVETTALQGAWPMARLKPGVTRAAANDELKLLAKVLTDRFGLRGEPYGFELVPQTQQREEMRDIQKAMLGAALLVLLIACVNLAHLMLARGLAKRKEFALRLAVGATRGAVVRQMFTECALITAAGVALGLVVTIWGADVLQNRMPPEVAWVGLVRPQLSWRVFALGTGAAVLSAVAFGLLPAIRIALDVDVNEPLKDDTGTTTGRSRQRYNPLVISEVALALVLLMAGGLLLRTVLELSREQLNFDTRALHTVWVMGVWRQNAEGRWSIDSAASEQRRRDVLAVVRGADQVRDVAFRSMGRLRGAAISAELQDSARTLAMQSYSLVTPNYITVLGLPILRGRNFEPGDAAGRGVAIIDPLAAQRLYPNQDPIGRMIKLGRPETDAPWIPIVGLMRSPSALGGDARYAPEPTVLVSGRDVESRGSLLIRLKSTEPRYAAQLITRLRSAVGRNIWVQPYDQEHQAELVSRAFLAKVFVGMGTVALALAAMGLYGVLAYSVSRRMREFAVRIALGAEARQLRGLVLHDGAVMLLAGTGAGAFAALAASRYLDAVLVSVLSSDVIALVLSETVLLGVGFAAALAPARRAARANPMDIMRAV